MKVKPYWKTISKLTAEIQYNRKAKCWRIKTAKQITEPIPMEERDWVSWLIGAGGTYKGILRVRREPPEFHQP